MGLDLAEVLIKPSAFGDNPVTTVINQQSIVNLVEFCIISLIVYKCGTSGYLTVFMVTTQQLLKETQFDTLSKILIENKERNI